MKTTKRTTLMALVMTVLIGIAFLLPASAAGSQKVPQPSPGPVWYYYGSPALPGVLEATGATTGTADQRDGCWYYYGSPQLPAVLDAIPAALPYTRVEIYTPIVTDCPAEAEGCWYYYGSPKLTSVLQAIKAGRAYSRCDIYTPTRVG